MAVDGLLKLVTAVFGVDETTALIILLGVGYLLAGILGHLLNRAGRSISRGLRRAIASDELGSLSGAEFEHLLAELFRRKGFAVEMTPASGDYGVDLILTNPAGGERIAVQAKRWSQTVGIEAVQEVYFGAAYYGCQRALVITTAGYSPNARQGAARTGVWLIDGAELRGEYARLFGRSQQQIA